MDKHNSEWGLEALCITPVAHTQESLLVFSNCFPAQSSFLLERRYVLHDSSQLCS